MVRLWGDSASHSTREPFSSKASQGGHGRWWEESVQALAQIGANEVLKDMHFLAKEGGLAAAVGFSSLLSSFTVFFYFHLFSLKQTFIY